MTRHRDHGGNKGGVPSDPAPQGGVDPLSLATLIGVVAVLMISFSTWRGMERLERRLEEVEGRIGGGSPQRMTAEGPVRRGPDPNRVYSIRTEGAPAKGPAGAPVTIAEFSDFQ